MANYFCTDSVEEQVDYLTDKVKDLKTTKLDKAAIVQEAGTGTDVVISQKAVTDGFASKTELNGKLTKPANPSAESAVTMLADGTVGTKALSEIGGKLYRHDFKLLDGTHQSTAVSDFSLYSSTIKTYTLSDLKKLYDYTPIIGNTSDNGISYINLMAFNELEDPNWYIMYAHTNTDTEKNRILKVTEILFQVTTEV